MMLLTQNFDAASPVTQINQGRACDLGRGLQVKSKIRSPHSTHNLKILQCNINGLTSPATRIKLDQLLEIALKQDVKVIAVQETKLKESTALKVKGFNIFRVDRKSKSGGGFPDDKAAANGLAVYYQETSKLVFTSENKSVMKRARTSSMAVAKSDGGDQGCQGTSHSKNFC
ncbi:uncharacterized protein TNCV_1112911 [Trichonephila clavipes]|nr:uncharacterized protein TNCV_1112911 [Trichonephila clavipes]